MINLKKPEKVCQRCVMDSSVKDIVFYPDGRCSLCRNYDDNLSKEIHADQQGKERFKKLITMVVTIEVNDKIFMDYDLNI